MTATADFPATPSLRQAWPAILGLGATQMIGWGTTFSPLAIFATPIGRDLDLSRETVFTGIAIMLVACAVMAPRVGRFVDRHGARPVMITGSIVAAVAMLAMAGAQDYWSYGFGWLLAGCAMPMMLGNAALPGLVQVVGPDARRAITALTLVSGFTSTIFLPLFSWLLGVVGWRCAYLVAAAIHLGICLPIHWTVLRHRHPPPEQSNPTRMNDITNDIMVAGSLPQSARPLALALIALWSAAEGLLTWGFYMQAIDVLTALEISMVTAVGAWALIGPAQASARLGELLLGNRYPVWTTAIVAAVMSALAFLLIAILGLSPAMLYVFTICLGFGHGFFAVARNTLPLQLFGAREYGTYMGRLTRPQNIINALAPIAFAAIITKHGPGAAFALAGAATALGLLAVAVLVWFCRTVRPDGNE